MQSTRFDANAPRGGTRDASSNDLVQPPSPAKSAARAESQDLYVGEKLAGATRSMFDSVLLFLQPWVAPPLCTTPTGRAATVHQSRP